MTCFGDEPNARARCQQPRPAVRGGLLTTDLRSTVDTPGANSVAPLHLPPSRCGRLGLAACGPFSHNQMIGALETVAQLCALGLGLGRNDITSLMHEGPHLLAPTGEPDCDDKNRTRALDRTNAVHRQCRTETSRWFGRARGGGRGSRDDRGTCLSIQQHRNMRRGIPPARPPLFSLCERLAPICSL